MWVNLDAYWGDVGVEVTPQWYGLRAAALGVEPPEVVLTRVGLVIGDTIVATPAPTDDEQPG